MTKINQKNKKTFYFYTIAKQTINKHQIPTKPKTFAPAGFVVTLNPAIVVDVPFVVVVVPAGVDVVAAAVVVLVVVAIVVVVAFTVVVVVAFAVVVVVGATVVVVGFEVVGATVVAAVVVVVAAVVVVLGAIVVVVVATHAAKVNEYGIATIVAGHGKVMHCCKYPIEIVIAWSTDVHVAFMK